MEHALRQAAASTVTRPVLVHVITRKGMGYALAEQNDEDDQMHQVPAAIDSRDDPRQGWPSRLCPAPVLDRRRSPTTMVAIGAKPPPRHRGDHRRDARSTVGLAPFRPRFPDRVYDVGIAEQHAMTMASRPGDGGHAR